MSNADTLALFAMREYIDLDLKEYGAKFAGKVLKVCVNAPGIVEAFLGGRAFEVTSETDATGQPVTRIQYAEEAEGKELARQRRAVALLYEIPLEQAQKLDDDFVTWLFGRGRELYEQHHEEMRKN